MSYSKGNQNNATIFAKFINDILMDVASGACQTQRTTKKKGQACNTNKRNAARMYRNGRAGELLANIVETDTTYEIHAVIPGFKRSDINISIENNLLTIKAVKSDDKKAEAPSYRRKEYVLTNKERSFQISDKVDTDAIRAKTDSGILTVILPKKENKKDTKNITIS